MRRVAFLILAVIILLAGVISAYAKDYEMTKKAGDYTVVVTIDKNPPVTGKNNMVVGIKDGAGKDVIDAVVAVDYVMPAMPGMPAMNYKAGANLKDNRYLTTLDFSMSGAWSVGIKITKAGKTQTVKLNVDVK
jgi:hypothetical protein